MAILVHKHIMNLYYEPIFLLGSENGKTMFSTVKFVSKASYSASCGWVSLLCMSVWVYQVCGIVGGLFCQDVFSLSLLMLTS